MPITLEVLGQGSFNKVYKVSEDSKVLGVFKEQTQLEPAPLPKNAPAIAVVYEENAHRNMSLDTVDRSIKIWNEINPTMPAKEFTVTIKGVQKKGWLSPYVEGRQANDMEIVTTLIDIYQRTGRIVVDAVGKKNIVTPTGGKPVCIDVGMAVKVDNEYGPLPRIRNTRMHGNREDLPGLSQWRDLQAAYSSSYYPDFTHKFPHSIMVIKSLFFLNRHRPELKDVNFLVDSATAKIIADAYDKELMDVNESEVLINKALAKIDQLAASPIVAPLVVPPATAVPFVPPEKIDPNVTPENFDPSVTPQNANPRVTLENVSPSATPESVNSRGSLETVNLDVTPENVNSRVKSKKPDVHTIKTVVRNYLAHLEQKLAENNIVFTLKTELTTPKDTPSAVGKLITRYNSIVALNNTIGSKAVLSDEDMKSAITPVVACLNNLPDTSEKPFTKSLTNLFGIGLKELFQAHKESITQAPEEDTGRPTL